MNKAEVLHYVNTLEVCIGQGLEKKFTKTMDEIFELYLSNIDLKAEEVFMNTIKSIEPSLFLYYLNNGSNEATSYCTDWVESLTPGAECTD